MQSISLTPFPVTILNGQSLSAPLAMGADYLVGISMPALWTAASLTFQVSPDGGATWQELVDSAGAAISFTVAAATFITPIAAPPTAWLGINMIKIRSGTLGVPVAQGADRIITVVGRHRVY